LVKSARVYQLRSLYHSINGKKVATLAVTMYEYNQVSELSNTYMNRHKVEERCFKEARGNSCSTAERAVIN